eukprot:COSAG03_NODE_22298_length_293_cov_0.396907_1_plen_43_part_10
MVVVEEKAAYSIKSGEGNAPECSSGSSVAPMGTKRYGPVGVGY